MVEMTEVLDVADARGALHHVSGLPVVSDGITDPVTGESMLFVSYCDPQLITSPDGTSELEAWLSRTALQDAVVRTPGGVTVPTRWTAKTRYVALEHVSPYYRDRDLSHVVRAGGPRDEPYVARSLRTACERGYAGVTSADEARIEAFVGDIVDDPSRTSFVATTPAGATVGHLTVRPYAQDDVTAWVHGGRTELVDAFAELTAPVGVVIDDLVAYGSRHVELPLIATVVHGDPAAAVQILTTLEGKGWALRAVDWAVSAGPQGVR